jgi:catechol 2,3-dioxygenase-like lactoylglutathione lyase family enzyme
MTGQKPLVECVIPILRVADLGRSLDWYASVLGFKRDWGADAASPGMASVSRDGKAIMLCQGGQGSPGTWVWVGVEDVEPLYLQLRQAGARIIQAPTNYWWALEIRIEDPDGHVLRFGSEPRDDRPRVG